MKLWLRQSVPVLLCDVAGVGGCGLIVFGVSGWSMPAAYLVAGAMLVAAAWLLSARHD